MAPRTTPSANEVWCLEHKFVPLLPELQRGWLASRFDRRTFAPQQSVFPIEDRGDRIYLITEGRVRVYRLAGDGKEISLALLGRGDMFGEHALFKQTGRTTIAQACERVTVWTAPSDEFLHIIAHLPHLTVRLTEIVDRKRVEAVMIIDGMARANIRGRLLMVLRRLARDVGTPTPEGVKISVLLSYDDLASFAGATAESCTLEVTSLQDAGLIRLGDDGHIVIPRPERLDGGPLGRIREKILGSLGML